MVLNWYPTISLQAHKNKIILEHMLFDPWDTQHKDFQSSIPTSFPLSV